MDFGQVEEKWRKRWEDSKIFESEPNDKEKFYLTVAFPYPSGGMHVRSPNHIIALIKQHIR